MKTIKYISILLTFFAITAHGQNQSIPIIAYGGVPHYKTSDENYRLMKECGFDIGITNFDSMKEMKQALDCAESNNIKIIGDCPELHKNPSSANQVKKHKALFGYYITDEPSAEKMKELAPEITRFKVTDNTRPCYMNLLPWYDKGQLRSLKTNSYEEYVRTLIESGAEIISFDIYPVQKQGIRPSWYENLEIIRRESRMANLPFWAFVLSTPHFDYPQPTLAQLRLQIYSNLAYGAQGIEYFTFWTPPAHDKYDYHNGPVDSNGTKTATYSIVQKMNKELHVVGQLFYGADVISVNHLGKIPDGTTKLQTPPLNISKIVVSGSEGAVVSQFTKDGHTYAAIVNRSYEKKMTVKIKASNKNPKRIKKDLESVPLKQRYTVPGGDILILKLD